MSYAIIRNAKYKLANMQSISRHNERQNKEYGNKDIDPNRTPDNYHLKQPQLRSYEKEFFRLREENGLKGNLRLSGKKQSNIACELLITSDADFFKRIGPDETRLYFETAYKFACQMCGEENILAAVVHMDEKTPHMHLTYIPVVEAVNKKGEKTKKVNCSEFWKGFNSYGVMQDSFHDFVVSHGFDLQRGEIRAEKREHLSVEAFKLQTAAKDAERAAEVAEKRKEVLISNANEKAKEIVSVALREAAEVRVGIEPLREEENALRAKLAVLERDIAGVELNIRDIEAIRPEKGIGGSVKGVSVAEVEGLKKTASAYHQLKYKYDKLAADYADLRKHVPTMEERVEQGKTRARLDLLEKAFERLPQEVREQLLPKQTRPHQQGRDVPKS